MYINYNIFHLHNSIILKSVRNKHNISPVRILQRQVILKRIPHTPIALNQ